MRIHGLVLCIMLSALLSCTNYQERMQKRADEATTTEGPIHIAIVWPVESSNYFLYGVGAAKRVLNERGGVMGRKIELELFDQLGASAESIATKIATNPEYVAVIGHSGSTSSLKAAITYEYSGLPFVSINASLPLLTNMLFDYVYRFHPDDKDLARAMVDFCLLKGYKNVAVVYARSSDGESLSSFFHELAVEHGLNIVTTKSYFASKKDYRRMLSELRQHAFDTVFIAGEPPAAAYLLTQARQMGITQPIIGGDSMDRRTLWEIAEKASNDVTIPSIYDDQKTSKLIIEFVNTFYENFELSPDSLAAQGYDTLMLLAYAMEKSGSADPVVFGSQLHFIENWTGITGTYNMGLDGQARGFEFVYKQSYDGAFIQLNKAGDLDMELLDWTVEESGYIEPPKDAGARGAYPLDDMTLQNVPEGTSPSRQQSPKGAAGKAVPDMPALSPEEIRELEGEMQNEGKVTIPDMPALSPEEIQELEGEMQSDGAVVIPDMPELSPEELKMLEEELGDL